ncbi:Arc family DNA-binding protein [Bombella saccharophila]|uniref:Arc family DNA-binding protein n=1 Tax=Bombella saccharophila TaxID=2967338 RepID=A0ABT3W7T3_9PROT|nr:Arc family DNA-binding protein [Bombella saccharophila]MCX5614449.1 Arc family DNA-binding protein [Bombella saccharophila]
MTLRLRPDVYEVVKRFAAENFRSMTAEINELLLEATKKASGANQSNPDASEQ